MEGSSTVVETTLSNERSLIKTYDQPIEELESVALSLGCSFQDEKFAKHMDEKDPLHHLRDEFFYPKIKDLDGVDVDIVDPEEDCIYFCGNSLGLCPKKTKEYTNTELDKWAKLGVQAHTRGDNPWIYFDEHLSTQMRKLVGGLDGEVAIMNGLTVNLHLLLISFYRPTKTRHKILFEGNVFPSDHYAFESQIKFHGFDLESSMLQVNPREGESCLRTEDILSIIEKEGHSIAVVCLSGVQYYTGQLFEIEKISRASKAKGCYVGWDLAHAVGNVELFLHDWDVDFACWCTYKYLNSGGGSLSGIFVHNKYRDNNFPKLEGWWGHKLSSRYIIDSEMESHSGALAWRISNTPVFLYPPMKASLEIFNKTPMTEIRAKSKLLTAYLEALLLQKYAISKNSMGSDNNYNTRKNNSKLADVKILTPSDPEHRGAQLTLSFSVNATHVFEELKKRGVVCDERTNVIRVAPAPLYCSFRDVYRFSNYLDEALNTASNK